MFAGDGVNAGSLELPAPYAILDEPKRGLIAWFTNENQTQNCGSELNSKRKISTNHINQSCKIVRTPTIKPNGFTTSPVLM